MIPDKSPLLEIRDLEVSFDLGKRGFFSGRRKQLKAVDGVTFDIRRGETVGLVGESGSGKTTVGRAILRVISPSGGQVLLHGEGAPLDLVPLGPKALRPLRPRMSLVFQDPYSSLNPRMTVRDIIAEPLVVAGLMRDRESIDARVRAIAARCKLDLEHLRRFPHAFSGGQRQRICIARALVAGPDFVVCDESVSALDVSIQAEIVNLLKDLQAETGTSFLFIAHDLNVVARISHRVAVIYVGRFAEYAPTESLFFHPRHPYTHALLSAVPEPDPDLPFRPERLQGEIPNPADAPPGCRFHTRCPFARPRCALEVPVWRELASDHFVACHYAEEFDFRRSREPAGTTPAKEREIP
ncbi:peptide/nickel transport system ATP-binding protein [Roseovarius sp. MBR-79]|jgi:peptide/nickel transport system ATP-binding protein